MISHDPAPWLDDSAALHEASARYAAQQERTPFLLLSVGSRSAGYPYLDWNTVSVLEQALLTEPFMGPLDVFIRARSGILAAAYVIYQMFTDYAATSTHDVRFIVTDLAQSAGCLVAFSGKEIVLAPRSFIGPFDPQSANSSQDDVADRLASWRNALTALLELSPNPIARSIDLQRWLLSGYLPHDISIGSSLAESMGLGISEADPLASELAAALPINLDLRRPYDPEKPVCFVGQLANPVAIHNTELAS